MVSIRNTGENANDGGRIGVAIVTFNGAAWISQCLDSLRDGTPVVVVVVDNGSTDDTCNLVQTQFPEVELVRCKHNAGFGAGNNVAISRLLGHGCEMILLLNQDAYVVEGSLQRLSAFLEQHDEYGVVSPLHCSPDEDHVDQKTLRGYLGVKATDFLNDAILGRRLTHYKIPGVNAAAWLVRSRVFQQVGGFDPMFFMYGEDDDLIARLKEHGVSFAFLPAARIVHLRQSPPSPKPKSWSERVRRRARLERSILLVQIKRPGYSNLYRIRMLLALGVLHPLASWNIRPDATELAAKIYATFQLLFEIRVIGRQATRLAAAGPHFLVVRDVDRAGH